MRRKRKTKRNGVRPPVDPVTDLIRTTRGSALIIAEALGISRTAVWKWPRVPAEHVMRVEALLRIPRHEIRPDLYPKHREAS